MKLAGATVWAACKGVWWLIDERNVALTAAGVAFYALFAMFPAVGALIALWSFWQDPVVIQSELETFRMAGDWRLYAEVLAAGGVVAYVARPLNHHRRHGGSVTHRLAADRHLAEVQRMQRHMRGLLRGALRCPM